MDASDAYTPPDTGSSGADAGGTAPDTISPTTDTTGTGADTSSSAPDAGDVTLADGARVDDGADPLDEAAMEVPQETTDGPSEEQAVWVEELDTPRPVLGDAMPAAHGADQPTTQLEVQAAAVVERLDFEPQLAKDWPNMSIDQRAEALSRIEHVSAEAMGRPPADLTLINEPALAGEYEPDSNRIGISTELLANEASYDEALKTVLHEGRHAYQHHAMRNPGTHPDQAQVDAWIENRFDYKDADLDAWEDYADQPLEADAFAFEDEAMRRLEERL